MRETACRFLAGGRHSATKQQHSNQSLSSAAPSLSFSAPPVVHTGRRADSAGNAQQGDGATERPESTPCSSPQSASTDERYKVVGRQGAGLEARAHQLARGYPPPRGVAAAVPNSGSHLYQSLMQHRNGPFSAGERAPCSARPRSAAKPVCCLAGSVRVQQGRTGALSCAARERRVWRSVEAALQDAGVGDLIGSAHLEKLSTSGAKSSAQASDGARAAALARPPLQKVVPYTIHEGTWDVSPHVRSQTWTPVDTHVTAIRYAQGARSDHAGCCTCARNRFLSALRTPVFVCKQCSSARYGA